jgi:hypothetical protein
MAGDTANSVFTVTPFTGDTALANNTVIRCDTINMSYDPNHKSVTPSGDIAAGTELEYLLEFENTGNDTAHNIHIMDTLSDYLDACTFRGGVSTHRVAAIKYRDAGRNIIKFDFPNIMLPDSSHHDLCRGMVTFRINAKSTLALGISIANRVGIYFDINEVVMTNTTYSNIAIPSRVANTKFSIVTLYPNPVRDVLNISVVGSAFNSISIYNAIGQRVLTEDIVNMNLMTNVSSLVSGVYYATLRGPNGIKTIKFEKL